MVQSVVCAGVTQWRGSATALSSGGGRAGPDRGPNCQSAPGRPPSRISCYSDAELSRDSDVGGVARGGPPHLPAPPRHRHPDHPLRPRRGYHHPRGLQYRPPVLRLRALVLLSLVRSNRRQRMCNTGREQLNTDLDFIIQNEERYQLFVII